MPNVTLEEPLTIDEIVELNSDLKNRETKLTKQGYMFLTLMGVGFLISFNMDAHKLIGALFILGLGAGMYYLLFTHTNLSSEQKKQENKLKVITPDQVDSLISKANRSEIKAYISKINAMDRRPIRLDLDNINEYLQLTDDNESYDEFKRIKDTD